MMYDKELQYISQIIRLESAPTTTKLKNLLLYLLNIYISF